MPQAIPINRDVQQLREALAELREVTDRPYIDIPLVGHESSWIPVVGSTGPGARGPLIPLSKGTVEMILRTRMGSLRDQLGNRATLRIKLYHDDY